MIVRVVAVFPMIRRLCKRLLSFFYVYSPEWTESPDKDWYSGFFKSAGKIYPHHGRLWLTVKRLKEHGAVRIPENARALIEGVYGEEADRLIPEGLRKRSNEAEGSDCADRSFAADAALSVNMGYTDEQTGWRDEAEISTRLGEETKTIYLAKQKNGALRPWRGDSDYPWQHSSVSIRSFLIKEAAENPQIPKDRLEECRKSLPAEGRWGVLLPLVKAETKNDWTAEAINENGKSVQYVYNKNIGLIEKSALY